MSNGECSKCGHVGPKIPTERVVADGAVYVDERGYQWKYNRCPACCSAKAARARLESSERAKRGTHWDALIKQSRALKSKDGRNDRAH